MVFGIYFQSGRIVLIYGYIVQNEEIKTEGEDSTNNTNNVTDNNTQNKILFMKLLQLKV